MKHFILSVIPLLLLILSENLGAAPSPWMITSPGDLVRGTVQLADLGGEADYPSNVVRLYYSVEAGGPSSYSEVVQASPMGLVREDKNFVDGLTFVSEGDVTTVDSTYTMVTGKRSVYRNYYNEKVLTFSAAGGNASIELHLRAYDDGFAFRYRFPETDASAVTITNEATGFRPPENSVMWMMAYNTTEDDYAPAYEDIWKRNLEVGADVGATAKPSDGTWCMPALYRTPDELWALLWESDVTPSYCNSRLSKANQLVFRILFPNESEGEGLGAVNPSSTLPWTMPWRVIITGSSPGTILESTLSTDLASPSVIDDVSWIRPGRSSWSWWSDNDSPVDYNKIIPFIDLAGEMTWEYSLVDAGWDSMINGTWERLISYAAGKQVGLNFWYNAGGPINSITHLTPRDLLHEESIRNSEFQKISNAGAKGVKIDFWLSDKQHAVQYYCDVFRDAAKYQLLVNIHGNTIPRGWQRTYPNLITAEAIRGAENYIWFPEDGDRFPWQNTIMPFTRNAVASMDWTPVTFTNLGNPHKTTYAHELALSVIFESGIQHFADRVAGYQTSTITAGVQAFCKEVPVAWDDTKYLQGYPGSWVALARRKGYNWYAAGIAGDTAREMVIPLTFLQSEPVKYARTLINDGSSETTFSESSDTVTAEESITVNTPARGGWVAKLTNLNPLAISKTIEKSRIYSVRPHYARVFSGLFVLPPGWNEKHTTIAVYRFDGRLIKRSTAPSRLIDLKKDFHLSEGVYILKLISKR